MTTPTTPAAQAAATPAPEEPTAALADVPYSPPSATAPVVQETQAQAVAALVKDLAARAWHTFWQTFLATLAALWAASGVDVHSLADLSSCVKAVIPILAAAGAAGLSAVKTVILGYFSAKKASSQST